MLKDTSTKTDTTNTREKRRKKRRAKLSTGFIFSTFSAIAAVFLGIGMLIMGHDPDSLVCLGIGAPIFVIGIGAGLFAIASLVFADKHNNPEGLFIEIEQQTEKMLAQKNGYINPSEVSKDAHLFFAGVELGNRDMIKCIPDSDDGDDGDDDDDDTNIFGSFLGDSCDGDEW